VASNSPEKGRPEDPKKSPTGSSNQQEAKLSQNPQIKKELTTGGMGRMT
jgi:hypothetical protein